MKLYSVKEAAKIVGVSTNTLYKYLDDGRIHAARGTAQQGRFRIPESALEEFLGIKLSTPEPIVESTTNQNTSIVSEPAPTGTLENRNTGIRSTPRLPLKIVRFFLFLALVAILADLFISPSVSLPGQLTRIFFLLIMLLLAYQEGGYRKG